LPQHPVDIRQALQIISDYPAQMLSKTSQSPFIHYRLAHGSLQGMPEPIAVALACVGMKLQSQSPAKNFFCNTFRDQREKITAELVSLLFCVRISRILMEASQPVPRTSRISARTSTLYSSIKLKVFYLQIDMKPHFRPLSFITNISLEYALLYQS
jgi:hypothetical protein